MGHLLHRLPIWRPSSSGLVGPRPGNAPQQAMTMMNAYDTPPPQASAGLLSALNAVPPPNQYMDGDDWLLETGATSHMTNNPSILSSSSKPISDSSIIVGNGAPLPVQRIGHAAIATAGSPLYLNNILISPHLIKNHISVRALTRDNFISMILTLLVSQSRISARR